MLLRVSHYIDNSFDVAVVVQRCDPLVPMGIKQDANTIWSSTVRCANCKGLGKVVIGRFIWIFGESNLLKAADKVSACLMQLILVVL